MDESQKNIAYQLVDQDGSGEISCDEFVQWFMENYTDHFEAMLAIQQYPEWMRWLIENFHWYDEDHSGSISLAEFKHVCNDYPAISESYLADIDKNGDNTISMSEFMYWAWEHNSLFMNEC